MPRGLYDHDEEGPWDSVLDETRVEIVPRLQVQRDSTVYVERFGIDTAVANRLAELAERINGKHIGQLLGCSSLANGAEFVPDGHMGFFDVTHHLDVGSDIARTWHFHGDPYDIAHQQWDRLELWPELALNIDRNRIAELAGPTHVPLQVARPKDKDAPVAGRDELVSMLVDAGIDADGAARIAAEARWGLVFEPGGTGESRLGGLPVLTEDVEWPQYEGRPMTHIATVALDEAGAMEGRELLPADGYLSFFAEWDEEPFEALEPGAPDHERMAITYTAADAATYEPDFPESLDPDYRFTETRVRLTPRLQVRRDDQSYVERFGVDALDAELLDELADKINGNDIAQMLGNPAIIHGLDYFAPDGHVRLFYVTDSTRVDFGGMRTWHFVGTPEDIRGQRWDQITVWPAF